MSRAWGRKAHFSEAKFKPPNASFISFVFSLQLAFHDLYSVFHFVNPLIPGAFCLTRFFFDILEIFWLNTGHISFNLVKTASTTWQLAFLPLASVLRHFGSGMRRNQTFEMRKWPTCSDWPSNGLACIKNLQRKHQQDEQVFPWSAAMRNGRKFCSKFFTQLFVHIPGAIRLSTLIWVLLEKSFPPGEVEYRWC